MTTLTIDQIRAKREEAETAIRNILEGLRQETGLTPVELDVRINSIDYDPLGNAYRKDRTVTGTAIHFEPI